MKQLLFFILLVNFSILILIHALPQRKIMQLKSQDLQDTCIIEGMVFKLFIKESPQELAATIKNGHLKVVDENKNNYRVIRYVFSVSPYERIASVVRNYGSLVSYPVILDLKQSSTGDRFYFENIVVANTNKEILNNGVKPLILERVK